MSDDTLLFKDMKWNDYSSDTLYLWNGTTLFRIAEGDGSNLWEEDREAGYKDYWITEYRDLDNANGGQWLETDYIKNLDYTIQGVMERLYDCDLWEDDWIVLSEDLGDELLDAFDKYGEAELQLKRVKEIVGKGDKMTTKVKCNWND